METLGIPTIQGTSHFESTNEDGAHNFLRYRGYCFHSTRPNSQPTLLCGNTEAVTWSCG